jgi:hypothetical protein
MSNQEQVQVVTESSTAHAHNINTAKEMKDMRASMRAAEEESVAAAVAALNGVPIKEEAKEEATEPSTETEQEASDTKSAQEPDPVEQETKPAVVAENEHNKETKVDERLEKSWSALSKADAKLRDERKAMKADREQMQKEIEEARAIKQAMKEDWFKAVQEHAGIKPEEMVELTAQRYLNQGKATQKEEVSKNADMAKQAMDEVKRLREELQQRDYQRQAEAYSASVDSTLNDDKYELLRSYPSAKDEVFKLVQGHLESHGELLPADVAVANIQDALVEQIRALQKTKAWQGLLVADQDEAPVKQKASPKPSAGKTLTNKIGTRTVKSDEADEMDDEERISRAAALIGWNKPG